MRVGLDGTPLILPTGGIGRYTLELTGALAEAYPDDAYWLVSDREFALPAGLAANVRKGEVPRSPLERRWWLWGLPRELERRQLDLFHGTDFSVPYRKLRPAVMTVHDLSPWRLEAQNWQPQAGRVRRRTPRLLRWGLADRVITPSEAVRREVVDRFALPADQVIAIPHAAADYFRPVEAPARERYFLFVGTLEPRKNIGRLVEAWRATRDRTRAELWLAGRVRADFVAPPEEPGLRMLGVVADAELPGLYSGALAVVYPSLYEGFGLPVLEAMQCGAAVVTSRDPAICEVTGGLAAVHVEATDVRALAEALVGVAENPERFSGLRQRALARASHFSWRKTAEQTRAVYQSVCGAGSKPTQDAERN
jgi:glycosyltransferase involved in cell wall biosynthesis